MATRETVVGRVVGLCAGRQVTSWRHPSNWTGFRSPERKLEITTARRSCRPTSPARLAAAVGCRTSTNQLSTDEGNGSCSGFWGGTGLFCAWGTRHSPAKGSSDPVRWGLSSSGPADPAAITARTNLVNVGLNPRSPRSSRCGKWWRRGDCGSVCGNRPADCWTPGIEKTPPLLRLAERTKNPKGQLRSRLVPWTERDFKKGKFFPVGKNRPASASRWRKDYSGSRM